MQLPTSLFNTSDHKHLCEAFLTPHRDTFDPFFNLSISIANTTTLAEMRLLVTQSRAFLDFLAYAQVNAELFKLSSPFCRNYLANMISLSTTLNDHIGSPIEVDTDYRFELNAEVIVH